MDIKSNGIDSNGTDIFVFGTFCFVATEVISGPTAIEVIKGSNFKITYIASKPIGHKIITAEITLWAFGFDAIEVISGPKAIEVMWGPNFIFTSIALKPRALDYLYVL